MNREEAAELLPIIKAFSEGKMIQLFVGGRWIDTGYITSNNSPQHYRIKPEPKYRPFANAEECWKEMRKHYPFGWVKLKATGKYFILQAVGNFFAVVGIDDRPINYDKLLDEYTFADGVPFGVKVEE